MDILLGLAILLVVCSLLALIVWQIVKFIAKLNGWKANDMPIHYHFIGVGAYFSIFWVLLYVLHVTVT